MMLLSGDVRVAFLINLSQSNFQRVDAEFVSDDVHLRLVGPRGLWTTVTAHRAGHRLICIDTVGIDFHVRNLVRTGGRDSAKLRYRRSFFGISAGVQINFHLAGENSSILANSGFHSHQRWMPAD